ncbi:MAG: long-chain fatty acid--CoA ligase [Sphaerochaetaceae bacterium]|nr:long-chain fatty acid--CoA ligase [Sphaerochaetaceae bacterium]
MPFTIAQMFETNSLKHPLFNVQMAKNSKGKYQSVTYEELRNKVHALAWSLHKLGVKRGDIVGIISDNRAQWLESDLAILSLGAADTPRGCDSMDHEIQYILSLTQARICFAENKAQLDKILSKKAELPNLEIIVVMDDRNIEENQINGVKIYFHDELVAQGKEEIGKDSNCDKFVRDEILKGEDEEVATIIFTSGTTGKPKGVVLTNRNIMYQTQPIQKHLRLREGMQLLSVLPIWHSFERIITYIALYVNACIAYSKPVGSVMLKDIATINPEIMGSVPRIWESVKAGVLASMKKKSPLVRTLFKFFMWIGSKKVKYDDLMRGSVGTFTKKSRVIQVIRAIIPWLLLKIPYAIGDKLIFSQVKSKLGSRFYAGISGGGSLSKDVQDFFAAMGVCIINGYGLTETAPVVGAEIEMNHTKGYLTPFEGTEIKVVDLETKKELPAGEKGVLFVRGPQVMKGYFKEPELTAKILDKDGWLNTGDNAVMTWDGKFAIRGRAKDTIVLSGGENIEPVPIEAKLQESFYIETAVVVGQDQKFLGALIVPDEEKVVQYLDSKNIKYKDKTSMYKLTEVHDLIHAQIQGLVNAKTGFKTFEQISQFTILEKSFEVNKELSAKQELKRSHVNDMYSKEIQQLFA